MEEYNSHQQVLGKNDECFVNCQICEMTGVVLIPKPVDALLKTNRAPERENFIFQASIFRCQLAVGFREGDSPHPNQTKNFHFDTVDGRNPANHLGCIKPCTVDDGINYQPQLVDAEFLPSTVSLDHDWQIQMFTPSLWSSIELPPHPNLRGHHQDHFACTFLAGNHYKPSFATVTG